MTSPAAGQAMYPYSTHCANNSSTKPGSPKTPTVRAFSRFSPSATPVTAAVAFTAHRARNPSAVFISSFRARRRGVRKIRSSVMRKKASSKPAMIF